MARFGVSYGGYGLMIDVLLNRPPVFYKWYLKLIMKPCVRLLV